jgi:hypothetical protein
MRRLLEEEAEAFELHYFVCADCATMLQHTAEYVEAMRAAAEKLRSDPQHTVACGAQSGSN